MLKVAERYVYPVGHGGFHGEKIGNDFYFIFDCGSKKKETIEKAIDKYYEGINNIDLLVISHFHSDHYKGLKKLIREKKIKKIMIPFLAEEQKVNAILESILRFGENDDNLDAFKENIKIIYDTKEYLDELKYKGQILIVGNFKEKIEESVFELEDLSKDIDIIRIQNGEKLKIIRDSIEWIYMPFNLSIEASKNVLLYNELSNLLDVQSNVNNLLTALKNKIVTLEKKDLNKFYKEIQGIYEKYSGEINEYSLCIYSGTYLKNQKVGCLYTGDYVAIGKNLEELKKEYNSVLETISWLQVPHHGSKDNFSQEIIFESVKNCFINVPRESKHHPDISVVFDIKSAGCQVHEVNELSEPICLVILKMCK